MRLRYSRYSLRKGVQKIKTRTALIITAAGLVVGGGGGISLAFLGTVNAATLDVCSSGCTYSTIQAAINNAASGDTVTVAAGTYTENVNVNKDITLIGAGSGVSGTVIHPANGNGLTISASGTSASPLTVENVSVTGATDGVYFDSPVSHVALNNVASVNNSTGIEVHNNAVLSDLSLTNVSATGSSIGFRVATTGSVDGLTVSNSSFDNNNIGFYVAADNHSITNEDNFTNIVVTNTSFSNDASKGLYAEKLSNAVFDNIAVNNSGYLGNYGSGFNVNEKYGTYQNITVQNSSVTNSGTGDPTNGTGINIEARNDGGYASKPATLTGVTVSGSIVTNNQVGIRFGETNQGNAGPTNVTVVRSDLSGSIVSGINNQTLSATTASCNWWGSASGPTNAVGNPSGTGVLATGSGDITFTPWLLTNDLSGPCAGGNHATTKDQCKNDGWQTLTDNNNRLFKNQGDCVSYVATHVKNQANG